MDSSQKTELRCVDAAMLGPGSNEPVCSTEGYQVGDCAEEIGHVPVRLELCQGVDG